MTAAPPTAREEPRTHAPLGRRLATGAGVEDLGAYRLIWASDPAGPPDPCPGQFYMLATASGWGSDDGRPYLPRAFSHARVLSDEGSASSSDDCGAPRLGLTRLAFLLDAVGPGTERLARLAPGEELWLSGPFGIGFRTSGGDLAASSSRQFRDPRPRSGRGLPEARNHANGMAGRRPVLVGGGIGTAPILALADELGPDARVLLGFRTAAHAAVAELFAGDPAVATDDGSRGRHALVTDLLRGELDRGGATTVYACGPPPMLEAVRALCDARGTPAQLALESGMACGYGACFGCVVPTRQGFVRLCLEGPVLDGDRLETALFEGAGH